MNSIPLNESQILNLRSRGLLQESEIAYKAGDLIIAENPISGEKRVLGQSSTVLTESNRRVLKG